MYCDIVVRAGLVERGQGRDGFVEGGEEPMEQQQEPHLLYVIVC